MIGGIRKILLVILEVGEQTGCITKVVREAFGLSVKAVQADLPNRLVMLHSCLSSATVYPQICYFYCMIRETNPRYYIPDYSGRLPDRRLAVRADKLARQLSMSPCSSIRKLSGTPAEHKANLRFLNNEKVEEEVLVKELSDRVEQIVTNKHVLVVTDACEVNVLIINENKINIHRKVHFL